MDKTLSIIPADSGTSDFPVLKAFQEYIDAEQAKARKRMLGLSVFFVVLLIVVVITFVMILTMVVNRNQALSDRLLDYALNERKSAPVTVTAVQPPQQLPQDVLKPFIERLEREQAELKIQYERQRKEAEAQAAAAEVRRAAEVEAIKAELAKERIRIQQENVRQNQIERHRRRLYPEYYESREPQPVQRPAQPASCSPAPVPAAKKQSPPLSEIKPLTYFNVDDENDVPFLMELPPK